MIIRFHWCCARIFSLANARSYHQSCSLCAYSKCNLWQRPSFFQSPMGIGRITVHKCCKGASRKQSSVWKWKDAFVLINNPGNTGRKSVCYWRKQREQLKDSREKRKPRLARTFVGIGSYCTHNTSYDEPVKVLCRGFALALLILQLLILPCGSYRLACSSGYSF